MTETERALIELIRGHSNPDKAFVTALNIIIEFLNHLEPSESKSPADSRESV